MPETGTSLSHLFRSKRFLIVLAAMACIVIAISGLVYAGAIPLSTILSCLGTAGTSRSFTIIASQNGYNNSKIVAGPTGLGVWPIMRVSRCDNVKISIINMDTQSHGLAVRTYTGEYSIAPGQTLTLHFIADRVGNWLVLCTILCTVHNYMQNGQLNVT